MRLKVRREPRLEERFPGYDPEEEKVQGRQRSTDARALLLLHRQLLHRLGERQPLGFHDEIKSAAVLAAAEAVIEALFLVDGERRRLFLVERAQAEMLAALLGQLDAAADNVGQPGSRAQILQELFGKGHRWSQRLTELGFNKARGHD